LVCWQALRWYSSRQSKQRRAEAERQKALAHEPVRLTVADVLREIRAASPDPFGELFRRTFVSLTDCRSPAAWTAVLDNETLGDHERLLRHAWDAVLGPMLRENEAALQPSSAEVLALWAATGQLSVYICRFLVNCREQNAFVWDPAANDWQGAEALTVETAPDWLIHNIEWSRPVLVTGTPDNAWHNPAAGRWCVVEAGSAESGLAQLCFYREILRTSSISVIRFRPELQHETFSEDRLDSAKPALLDLIGKLAGVT
jgi:hypothetical protein